jgi:hypothetical protein
MLTDYTASGEITEDGRLVLADREQFAKAMRSFKRGHVSLRVEVGGKRSVQANRYYRLLLGIISDETGDDPDYLHEFFKKKFLEPEYVEVLGESMEIYTSIKNPTRFRKYTEDIRRFVLVELHIDTPDPDPALRGQPRHAKRKQVA